MKYYELFDDIYYPNRWYLGDIYKIDNWLLRNKSIDITDDFLEIELYRDGMEMDYTITDAFGIPIVSEKFKDIVKDINGLSFMPVKIENKNTIKKYFVMIIHNEVDCVDEERSEFTKYIDNDPIRPDKAGKYSGFYKLKLDYSRVDKELFRLGKFLVKIIISERIKKLLIENNITGIDLTEV